MDQTPQHHSVGGWFALISLGGAAIVKFVTDYSAFFAGVASILTALAAGVSIWFTLRRKKAPEL
jgi:hypothetical protein